jgi:hypothetical protein
VAKYANDGAEIFAKYGDDVVNFITKHGDDSVEFIMNCSATTFDNIIKMSDDVADGVIKAAKNKCDAFFEALKKCDDYSDDIFSFLENAKYKDDAVELISQISDIGSPKANLSAAEVYEIIGNSKGNRPDVSSYLSKDYIDKHLSQFDGGVTIIQHSDAYNVFTLENGFAGVADDNTLFVMPKDYCDKIFEEADGDMSYVERALGFSEGYFAEHGGAWRLDVNDVSGLNLRIPNGNEYGANDFWIPGGYTSGGVPEAISDIIPIENINSTQIC